MQLSRTEIRAFCLAFSLCLIISSLGLPAAPAVLAAARQGAWVDTVTVSVESPDEAVSQLQNNQLDLYSTGLPYAAIAGQEMSNIAREDSSGLEYQLLLNVVGPEFPGTGKFNPFCSPKIREALNWLIDRNFLVASILHGTGEPLYLQFQQGFPEYERYRSDFAAVASEYAYNFSKAQAAIAAEMPLLGAAWTYGHWTYEGQIISLIFLIRTDSDGNRRPMGDYIADQLESVGFAIDRRYVTASQASPIWMGSDPADGLWHLYTGAWANTVLDRDQGSMFTEFYMPFSPQGIPLFQAYNPTQAFIDLANALNYWQFANWDERSVAFKQAMQLAMEDSAGVWLAAGHVLNLRQKNTTAGYDLAAGMSRIWPYTVRFDGAEGGNLRLGQDNLFGEPWNPISGSNWQFDAIVINATADDGLLPDPKTGLPMAQRIQSAAVTVQTGQVVQKTEDWVTLSYAPQIQVPGDAWVDWDAATQTFITAAQKFPDGITALVKSVVTYPADLFTTVKWHDGSPLDAADFVMAMIMKFDRTKPESAIYDSYAYPELAYSGFKGVRILSVNPLMIETYSDAIQHDAEADVFDWWPNTNYGPMPWHTLTLGIRAEAAGQLAFSYEKANDLGIPQTNFLPSSSLSILASQLALAQGSSYIPYLATLSAYITPTEAAARYANLTSWNGIHNHFWVGDGPFYLDSVNYSTQQAVLQRVTDFLDPAGKWDAFSEPFLHRLLFVPVIQR
jgi:peptide/nickel transport system substrate-binding protein